jgi:hypothetical protein
MRRTTLLSAMLVALLALIGSNPVAAQEGDFLWRVLTVRAAPGRLLELVDLYEEQAAVNRRAGDGEMFRMRHSQGDEWDLMMLFPMGSFGEYYGERRVAARRSGTSARGRSGAELERLIDAATSEREDLFARGPDPGVFAARYESAGLFHIEMFVALPDRREELLDQRRMENDFYRNLGRDPNMIFVREAGAPWDLFTLGFYESLLSYAQAGDLPEEQEDQAARQAGFQAADRIGTYLRSLMSRHRDTLARRVNR